MKKKAVIYLYNRFFDSLIQGNFWLYIDDYLQDSSRDIDFYLVTYEDPAFPLSAEQEAKCQAWQDKGLLWKRLTWHPGTSLVSKFLDVFSGMLALLSLRLKGYRHVVTLGSVAGGYAFVSCLLFRMKLFMYQFEPHSEYAIDNGMWPESSLQYKVAHYLERKSANFATAIASGTRFMEERLAKEWQVPASFFRIATVANDKKFIFDQALRDQTRSRLNIAQDAKVLFYPGKFGSLYYYEETAWMFRWLWDEDNSLHFLIVTPHSDEEIHELFSKASVPRSAYTIAHSEYVDIHQYFFAADFAVIAVPPGPSKQFISNIKVGEYLSAGLPFLITRGVSEDYWYAENKDVGVVVGDFVESEIKKAWPKINDYLSMDENERRDHCRKVGLAYRGFEVLNPVFKQAIACLTKD